jgi:hypothetical protein
MIKGRDAAEGFLLFSYFIEIIGAIYELWVLGEWLCDWEMIEFFGE